MKSVAIDLAKVTPNDFESALSEITTALPLRKIVDRIDRMAISADAKALLKDLASISVRIGDTLVHVRRKVIDYAMEIVTRFPNTTFGVIIVDFCESLTQFSVTP